MRKICVLLGVLGLLGLGCGDRDAVWDSEFRAEQIVGLHTAVAVMDSPLDRVLMLESPGPLELRATAVPVGKQVIDVQASPDKKRLFVLSGGVRPRRQTTDELPRLTVIDTEPSPRVARIYELQDPFSGMTLDPQGEWALLHGSGGSVENPNELILIDLRDLDEEPFSRSIRSLGGRPTNFTFTTPLTAPGVDPRRILVVQTAQDLTLIDLERLREDPEITIRTPDGQLNQPSRPAAVSFHDGEPDDDGDAGIAVSFENSSSVLLIRLAEGSGAHQFRTDLSTVEVGGVPNSIAFLMTEAGLRLAALVSSARHAALVDPSTSRVDLVSLGEPYSGLARITDDVEGADGSGDYALLWGATRRVGFWSLGRAVNAPYASVETFDIQVPVGRVLDVPGSGAGACLSDETCFAHYKVIESSTLGDFYVLDLRRRESSPMVTSGGQFSLSLSPDGRRVWAYRPGGTDFASVEFANLHAVSPETELPIRGVYDVGRPNREETEDEARSAIVLHQSGSSLSATLFDALEPDPAVTRFYGGLALGGLTR